MNRQLAPEIHKIQSIRTGFPEAEENIYHIPSTDGVFKLEIVYPNAGYGISGDKFAAIYAMDLLLSGTSDMNAHSISDKIDELGGYVFKSCEYYTSSISIFGLNENLDDLLGVVSAAVNDCIFDQKELNIYKSRKLSELEINLNKTAFLANRRINHMIFGKTHPYALPSSKESINSYTQETLIKFKNERLLNPYFIFTGPEDLDIRSVLQKHAYQIVPVSIDEISEEMPAESNEEMLYRKPGAQQNSIRMGKILPGREHRDFYTISLFNLILGGYFGSRLMKNIREEKGLTYGIHSGISPFRHYSLFKISSECNNKFTEQVQKEISIEIERLQNELVEEEELTIAKNYLSGALLRNFDGAYNIADRFKSLLDLNTATDYYENYFRHINMISADDIRKCANNYFQINTLKYCVSGEI